MVVGPCLISAPKTQIPNWNISALACVKSTALSEAGEMVREELSAATTGGI